jgi:hypothetical protein
MMCAAAVAGEGLVNWGVWPVMSLGFPGASRSRLDSMFPTAEARAEVCGLRSGAGIRPSIDRGQRLAMLSTVC